MLAVGMITGCSSSGSTESSDNKSSDKSADVEDTTENEKTETTQKNHYGLGDTFTFDDLELTIGTDVTYTTLDNQYADLNGSTVAKIPVTVKNLKR